MEKEKKKKSKWKKRLIIIGCILLVLVIIGCIAYRLIMNYLGDKIMNEMIKAQINGMLDSGEITIEEVEAIASGVTLQEETSPPEKEPSVEAPSETPDGDGKESPPQSDSSGNTTSDAPKPAVGESTAEQKPAVSPEKRAEVVQKAADKIEDSIPRDDKDAMISLIRSKLSSSDISYLAGLVRGGLTYDEWYKAYDLANKRFTKEELQQVNMYYHRYKSRIKIGNSAS